MTQGPGPERLMRKGEQTRVAIIAMAMDLASRRGLEGLTIGALAEGMGMSKSGVFAHFGSREELQLAVLKAYERHFIDEILVPALQMPRGIDRLRTLLERWITYIAQEAHGCIMVSGAFEYDDRPGAVRDALVHMIDGWNAEIKRAILQAVETGDLRIETEPDALIFAFHGIVLAVHHDTRLLKNDNAFKRGQQAMNQLLVSYSGAPVSSSS